MAVLEPGASRLHTHLSPPPGGAGGSGGARKRGSVARFRAVKLRAFPGRGVGAPAPGVEAARDLSLEQRGDISLVAPASTGLLNAQRSFFPAVSAEKLRREGADWETYCHPARARNGGLDAAATKIKLCITNFTNQDHALPSAVTPPPEFLAWIGPFFVLTWTVARGGQETPVRNGGMIWVTPETQLHINKQPGPGDVAAASAVAVMLVATERNRWERVPSRRCR
ncbi:uncharacterized protein [Equus przewalskii]|uniref:Uncharacterized protein n=1 Tax=Equus przewalskii TaxID=9798 RepID=A0ABM4LF31_EQUPR